MPPGASLTIRRKRDGSIHVQGEIPDAHAFNARQIDREMHHEFGSMFEVFVVMKTASHGDVAYLLTGFGELDPDNPDDDRKNYGTWEVKRIPDAVAKKFLKATEAKNG
jgi:hypothetical protein